MCIHINVCIMCIVADYVCIHILYRPVTSALVKFYIINDSVYLYIYVFELIYYYSRYFKQTKIRRVKKNNRTTFESLNFWYILKNKSF